MKIAVGADHAGVVLKDQLRDALRSAGHEVTDAGTNSTESTDYPDYAQAVAEGVASGAADKGILVCGSGVGMSIAANKVRGVRAVLGVNVETVRLSRQHNDANVVTLGSRLTDLGMAEEIVRAFLETAFDGGRHERRIEKITRMENL